MYPTHAVPPREVVADREVHLGWSVHLQVRRELHGYPCFGLRSRETHHLGRDEVELVLGRHDVRMEQFAKLLVERRVVRPEAVPVCDVQAVDALRPVVGGRSSRNLDRRVANPVRVHKTLNGRVDAAIRALRGLYEGAVVGHWVHQLRPLKGAANQDIYYPLLDPLLRVQPKRKTALDAGRDSNGELPLWAASLDRLVNALDPLGHCLAALFHLIGMEEVRGVVQL